MKESYSLPACDFTVGLHELQGLFHFTQTLPFFQQFRNPYHSKILLFAHLWAGCMHTDIHVQVQLHVYVHVAVAMQVWQA